MQFLCPRRRTLSTTPKVSEVEGILEGVAGGGMRLLAVRLTTVDILDIGGGTYRGGYQYDTDRKSKRTYNPTGSDGDTLKCAICESVFHFARNCPDS